MANQKGLLIDTQHYQVSYDRVKTYKSPSTRVDTFHFDQSLSKSRRYKSSVIKSDGHKPTSWFHAHQESSLSHFTGTHQSSEAEFSDNVYRSALPSADGLFSFGGSDASISIDANSYNRVITNAMSNLNNSKLDVGVAFGEILQTSGYIADTALGALQFLKAVKHADFNKLKTYFKGLKFNEIPKKLSDRWLEYSFAFSPLANDVFNAANVHNNGIAEKNNVPIQAGSRYSFSDSKEVQSVDLLFRAEATAKYSCKIRAIISDDNLRALSLLGLENPYEIIWELVPFSFAVDYLVPIGTWMNALSAPLSLQFESGYVSILGKVNGSYSYRGQIGDENGNFFSEEIDDDIIYKSSGFVRNPFGDFPKPLPYVKNPLKSVRHLTNVAALLTSLRST